MELKPCPFCGTLARRIKNHGCSADFWGHCRKCFADGPMAPTKDEAIAAWNTRIPDPRIAELEAQIAAKGPTTRIGAGSGDAGIRSSIKLHTYSVGGALAEKGK